MISEYDWSLVKSFLHREAKDFKEPALRFIGSRVDVIAKRLKKFQGCDYIVFKSLTNLGMIDRELHITPTKWDQKRGNIIIVLCPCGKLSHWGYIYREQSKKI